MPDTVKMFVELQIVLNSRKSSSRLKIMQKKKKQASLHYHGFQAEIVKVQIKSRCESEAPFTEYIMERADLHKSKRLNSAIAKGISSQSSIKLR